VGGAAVGARVREGLRVIHAGFEKKLKVGGASGESGEGRRGSGLIDVKKKGDVLIPTGRA